MKSLNVVSHSRCYLKYAVNKWLNKLNNGTSKILPMDPCFSPYNPVYKVPFTRIKEIIMYYNVMQRK